ncbi:hypothetical protein GWN26_01865 [Candidatus Saccharibacteria bacterium]|nr:hypothetical protein [Candidatus Saccharibacteria bacterium]
MNEGMAPEKRYGKLPNTENDSHPKATMANPSLGLKNHARIVWRKMRLNQRWQ